MDLDQSLFDCIKFEDPLITIPPLNYSDQMADALVPLPASFDDHFNDISDLISLNPFDISTSLPLLPQNYYDPLPPLNEVSFDHGFIWDKSSISRDVIIDVVPLNNIDDSMLSYEFEANENLGVDNIEDQRRISNGRSKLGEIGLDEMKSYFYMPITRAAKEMNVGVTLLKKRCRELGIPRWPHRKMKSLNTLIHNVQELGKGSNEECIRRELETLEEHRRLMEENPELQLTERTKKLRQACFKANYKRRRTMQQPLL